MNNAQTKYAILGCLALLVVVFFGGCLSYRSDCVGLEAAIPAQYEQNRNNYDNMWKRFKEMAQVPGMYTEDLKKLFDGTMAGRYGTDGPGLVFKFVQEHNPSLDGAMYTQLQRAIEAGRVSFMSDQQQLIDKKREYQTVLNGNSGLFYNWILGYPRIDMNKYGIVTSDETKVAFDSGTSDPIKLR